MNNSQRTTPFIDSKLPNRTCSSHVGTVLKVLHYAADKAWGEKTMAVILSESMLSEFKVRVDFLMKTIERPEPEEEVGEFRVGRLVVGDGGETGLLIRLEAGNRAQVLSRLCVQLKGGGGVGGGVCVCCR